MNREEFLEIKTQAAQLIEWADKCPVFCLGGRMVQNYVKLWKEFEKLSKKMRGEKMPNFNIMHWVSVGTSVVMNLFSKMADGNVTLVEGVDVLEDGIKRALPEASAGDFARFGAITSQQELDAFEFQDGDVLISVPVELVGKIKVEFGN